jgi:hypothetical protein
MPSTAVSHLSSHTHFSTQTLTALFHPLLSSLPGLTSLPSQSQATPLMLSTPLFEVLNEGAATSSAVQVPKRMLSPRIEGRRDFMENVARLCPYPSWCEDPMPDEVCPLFGGLLMILVYGNVEQGKQGKGEEGEDEEDEDEDEDDEAEEEEDDDEEEDDEDYEEEAVAEDDDEDEDDEDDDDDADESRREPFDPPP